MPPCATFHKELYFPTPGGATVWCSQRYLGPGLRLEEKRSDEYMDDFHMHYRRRVSEDNGRTWGPWLNLPDPPRKDGMQMERWDLCILHDPHTRRTIQMVFIRLFEGTGDEAIQKFWREKVQTFWDHMSYELSSDEGRTWSPMRALKFEPGPDFNHDNWADKGFLAANQMYGGYNLIQARDGTLLYPGTIDAQHRHPDGTVDPVRGMVCMRGTWDSAADDYRWEASQHVTVPLRLSGRGLLEPAIAELRDGRILVCMRGASTYFGYSGWKGKVESPGRCWHTLSGDGGRTWGEVAPLCFDTGEPVNAPDAFSKMLRSERTGKLYWFGNSLDQPIINEDGLRRPLVMAEVDEASVTLKKDSLVVLAERDPARDAERVQFSNFGLLDNRQTGNIELLMPHFGENPPLPDGSFDYTADTYRYIITPH